jgi:hypothetical protein
MGRRFSYRRRLGCRWLRLVVAGPGCHSGSFPRSSFRSFTTARRTTEPRLRSTRRRPRRWIPPRHRRIPRRRHRRILRVPRRTRRRWFHRLVTRCRSYHHRAIRYPSYRRSYLRRRCQSRARWCCWDQVSSAWWVWRSVGAGSSRYDADIDVRLHLKEPGAEISAPCQYRYDIRVSIRRSGTSQMSATVA